MPLEGKDGQNPVRKEGSQAWGWRRRERGREEAQHGARVRREKDVEAGQAGGHFQIRSLLWIRNRVKREQTPRPKVHKGIPRHLLGRRREKLAWKWSFPSASGPSLRFSHGRQNALVPPTSSYVLSLPLPLVKALGANDTDGPIVAALGHGGESG
jgi:hypothetical protein